MAGWRESIRQDSMDADLFVERLDDDVPDFVFARVCQASVADDYSLWAFLFQMDGWGW